MRINLSDRNTWLIVCFVAYIALLPIFGLIYYAVFRSNPQNFSFNTDILKAQALSFKLSTEQELTKLRAKLDAYRQFADDLSHRSEPPNLANGEVTFNLPNYKFTFFIPVQAPVGESKKQQNSLAVIICDQNGNEISRDAVDSFLGSRFPNQLSRYRGIANSLINSLNNSIAEDERKLATLEGPTPEVWSFWDFLYFSVITQTTVGYGDILPNSTLVRLLVVSQVLIGLAVVTVVINMIFIRGRA
jgi:hypothetical protein